MDELEELAAENERLRAALTEIRDMLNADYPEWRIANAALACGPQ